MLGAIYYKQNEFAKASEVLENVVSMAPENSQAKQLLQVCREQGI
jgi:uncharacterized protein HemY